MRSDAFRYSRMVVGESKSILEIPSASSLAYPGMCVTSRVACTDEERHNLSTKKHKGDLVVNMEFDVDSAAVLSP